MITKRATAMKKAAVSKRVSDKVKRIDEKNAPETMVNTQSTLAAKTM